MIGIVEASVCKTQNERGCINWQIETSLSRVIELPDTSDDTISRFLDKLTEEIQLKNFLGFKLKSRDYKLFDSYKEASDYFLTVQLKHQ